MAAESLQRITRGACASARSSAGLAEAPGRARAAERPPSAPGVDSMSQPSETRFPWWLLVVAFVVVPLVEIYVIIQVGQVIGAWWTIAPADRRQRPRRLAGQARGRPGLAGAADGPASERRMPHRELADGVLDPGRRHC